MTGSAMILAPGSTIGILGGGQLGRMLALAAARLGLRCHVYSDAADAPAFDVVAARTVGAYDDVDAVARFAAAVGAVTYEFENVPVVAAEAAAAHCPVYPPPQALRSTQDRLVEKDFIAGLGIPVAPYRGVEDAAGLAAAIAALGLPAHLKARRFGYDGKGQARLEGASIIDAAFAAIGAVPAILESHIAFAAEVSVIGVRGRDGAFAVYDVPENTHADGILRRSVVPSRLPGPIEQRAKEMTRGIATALDYVGVIGVEMFYLGAGAPEPLVVNEIAPRVHNSGHWTIEAALTSQFENHIRAVAGWPLGATTRLGAVAMENLIGADADRWSAIAAEAGATLHLYGKSETRPGRKMGHVTRRQPPSAAPGSTA